MLKMPTEILSNERESLPNWIRDEPDFNRKSFGSFIDSRVVFYPGSGTDGHALRLFGGTRSAHCFVHADYCISGYGKNPKGYRAIKRSKLDAYELTELLELDRSPPLNEQNLCSKPDFGWTSWIIFKRMKTYDQSHGGEYLVLLHVCAEAVWVFQNFWARRTAPYAIVLQDHGLGGNWATTKFGGRDSRLYQLAAESKCCPLWLVVGDENTEAWPGYSVWSQPDRPTGMHGHCRRLYRR
jgi:hypothetical protein